MKAKKPKTIKVSLNWQKQYYVAQLLASGIHGNTVEEVVDRLISDAMNACIADGIIESVRRRDG